MRRPMVCLVTLAHAACGGQPPPAPRSEEIAAPEPPPRPAAPFKAVFPAWYEPAEPFRVIGELYSVGPRGLGVFLLPTSEGHILIDGGVPESPPIVVENVRALGFDPADIRILLNTHAHFDHSGGLAELKALTGARLLAHTGDRSALEGGFYLGYEDNPLFGAPAVVVDEAIEDGAVVSLGGVELTAHHTPGHTRGCTSWTMDMAEGGEIYEVLLFCSASVAANRLVGPPQYAGIVADYQRTFAITRDWRPDVFLSNHPEFFGLEEKRAAQLAGDDLAFVDPTEFSTFIGEAEADFADALATQTATTQTK